MCFGERTACCSNRNCCSDEDEAELAERAQTSPSALLAQPQRAGRDAAPRAGGSQSPPLRQERVKHFPEPAGKRPGSEAPAGLAASTGAEEASGRAPAPAAPADPADDEYAHALRSSRVASLAGGAGGAMVQDESSLSSPRASSKGRTEGLPPFLASPRGRPVHSPRVPPLAIGEVVAHSDTDAFSERSFGEDLGIAFPFGLGAKGEAESAALAKEYRDRLQKYRDQLRTKARHRLCPPLPARRPPRPPPALLVAAR